MDLLKLSRNSKVYLATAVLAVTALWTLHSIANSNRLKRLKQALKSKSSIHQ